MIDVIKSLQLLDREMICFHEEYEPNRLNQTTLAIEREGLLRHPPLAMKLHDGRYVILDGAHRVHALQKLGCKRVVVQLVNPKNILLSAWDHIIPEGRWMEQLYQNQEIRWEKKEKEETPLAVLHTNNGVSYLYLKERGASLFTVLFIWHQIVRAYKQAHEIIRIASGKEYELKGMTRLCYPIYSLEELEQIVLANKVMPAGVTRVTVDGRLLNLNIPLSFLRNSNLEQMLWQNYLEKWSRSLRLYTESVYLCEV
ncbi:ParB N-terminal domain-containing protein [Brevibacillus laterosporus]|uniref:ParB-like N-terminal domain-containing protein n=1 Tax=Brevibacillus laterosporus TaxID=1465 RepID=A0A0F7EJA3_BRELA|nr:ParB N-terminal domain-containing protein [Brevibacillus laterosporus]AKF95960.1 hypothetical protein EX87_20505 [Brevibacillus laterosporus]